MKYIYIQDSGLKLKLMSKKHTVMADYIILLLPLKDGINLSFMYQCHKSKTPIFF